MGTLCHARESDLEHKTPPLLFTNVYRLISLAKVHIKYTLEGMERPGIHRREQRNKQSVYKTGSADGSRPLRGTGLACGERGTQRKVPAQGIGGRHCGQQEGWSAVTSPERSLVGGNQAAGPRDSPAGRKRKRCPHSMGQQGCLSSSKAGDNGGSGINKTGRRVGHSRNAAGTGNEGGGAGSTTKERH